MAVFIGLVPALNAADMVLVPTFDLADPDEEMATETTASPAMIVGEDGQALVTGDAVGSSSSATRRRRVRAPRRRALGPPPPRLFDEDGHVTSTCERVQSDTRWGRCFFFLSARFASDSVARRECSAHVSRERPSELAHAPRAHAAAGGPARFPQGRLLPGAHPLVTGRQ